MADDRLHDRAIDVFRKFWKANPDLPDDATLLHQSRRDLATARDVRSSCAERSSSRNPAWRASYAQWDLFRTVMGWVLGGTGPGAAAEPGDAPAWISPTRGASSTTSPPRVASARKSRSGWTAADFYLAMIACRAGRYDEARALVRKLADPKTKDDSLMSSIYPFFAFMAVGGELEAHPATDRRRDRPLRMGHEPAVLPDVRAVRSGTAPRLPADPSPRACRAGSTTYAASRSPSPGTRVPPRGPRNSTGSPGSIALREMARKLADLGYAADALTALQRGAPPRRADPARQLELLSGFAAIPQTDPRGPRIHPGRPDLRRAGPDRGPIDRRRIRRPTGRAVRRG